MSNEKFIFENNGGEVLRILNWQSDKLCVVHNINMRRLEFIEDISCIEFDTENYVKISELAKDQLKSGPIKISSLGFLRQASDSSALRLVSEVEPNPEDEKSLLPFIKYSAIGHLTLLTLFFISSWILHRYFEKAADMVTVQVFEQSQIPELKERQVEVSKTKILNVANKSNIKKRDVGRNRKVSRLKIGIQNRGALGVLGGYGRGFSGSGGLNIKAKSNNPGIGYGGTAMRGGFERGLLGRGLVATGVGNGGSMYGYGGYATKGKAGGRPGHGYGAQRMAGSSRAYFQPLSEEPLVEGGLDQDQINAVIQSHIGQVVNCYERGLQSKPSLSGRVAVKFVIGPAGGVNSAHVSHTSLDSRNVESCIVNKLRGWRFPRPFGNVSVRVTYPFVLKRLSQG
ncbi:MAG: hypothetical protein A2Z20_10850 [Bdellovibrionales bacterium RBG_16_40_8]|nr:MAG: hypothetical protein A2Z20_10850 [Bdellovibrionales bacterium RBG_16_40_8]